MAADSPSPYNNDRFRNSVARNPDKKDDGWDPEAVLKAAVEERELMSLTNEEQGERIFKEHLPNAAVAICHIATHSENERLRLDAAKYVVERNLGKIPTATERAMLRAAKGGPDAEPDTFEAFINGLTVDDTSARAEAEAIRRLHGDQPDTKLNEDPTRRP